MSIIFKTYKGEIQIDTDHRATILELARNQGIFLKSSCSGKGKCGNCRVLLLEGQFISAHREIMTVPSSPQITLACQTRVQSDNAVIEIPQQSLVEEKGRIVEDIILKKFDLNPSLKKYYLSIPKATLKNQVSDLQRVRDELGQQEEIENLKIPLSVLRKLPQALIQGNQKITITLDRIDRSWMMIDVEPADTRNIIYGLVLDIGTTTVVGWLIDLTTSKILNKASLFNQQIRVGEDVISRISFISSRKEMDQLTELVVEYTVNPLIKHLCLESGIQYTNIYRTVLSGNTVMIHLLLGLDPSSIGKIPFQPVIRNTELFNATEVGITICPAGRVDYIPAVSGYIGGDVVSDVYVSRLQEQKGLSILVDIGTNGEIVMYNQSKMVACSTAAGPAFEGYGLQHGCLATTGAIEKIQFDRQNKLHYKIIGRGKAMGICGSGVIDFMAEGLKIGLLNQSGRMNDKMLKNLGLKIKIEENGNFIKGCIIVPTKDSAIKEPIVITEKDISHILQAKAAIYAGILTLLSINNYKIADIKKFIVTGGFGKYIDLSNAVAIGLLPDIPISRIEALGNGSIAGAYLTLIDSKARDEMSRISSQIKVIELNRYKEFSKYFMDSLFLPVRVND